MVFIKPGLSLITQPETDFLKLEIKSAKIKIFIVEICYNAI